MRVLDLFSGIGGFSLGLERVGMRTVAFCEIEPYCRAVLRRHWPHVPIFDDVRELSGRRLESMGIAVDLVCGGFPCQDLSVAGKGAGLAGERSGLWVEFARIIGDLRPRYVIVENVAILLGRGVEQILGDLAALGFDAEWHCIPACAVGAPHRRDRLWIVAYTGGDLLRDSKQRMPGRRADGIRHQGDAVARNDGAAESMADADMGRRQGLGLAQHRDQQGALGNQFDGRRARGRRHRAHVAVTGEPRLSLRSWEIRQWAHAATAGGGWWHTEPGVGRVAHGVPYRVDRLRALGNAIVPQIAEIIGRKIMQHEREQTNSDTALTCALCDGGGNCINCDGSGEGHAGPCEFCEGTGACPECGGSGFEPEE